MGGVVMTTMAKGVPVGAQSHSDVSQAKGNT